MSPEAEAAWEKAGEFAAFAKANFHKPLTKQPNGEPIGDGLDYLRLSYIFPDSALAVLFELRMLLLHRDQLKRKRKRAAVSQRKKVEVEFAVKRNDLLRATRGQEVATPVQREIFHAKICGANGD